MTFKSLTPNGPIGGNNAGPLLTDVHRPRGRRSEASWQAPSVAPAVVDLNPPIQPQPQPQGHRGADHPVVGATGRPPAHRANVLPGGLPDGLPDAPDAN
jgi:hypothetical protein